MTNDTQTVNSADLENSYPYTPPSGSDEDGRELLRRLAQRAVGEEAIAEYEWRVTHDLPYEDAVSAEEFSARYLT